MSRDLGVTVTLREFLPEWAAELFVLLALPGDLLVIIALLGLFYTMDVLESLRKNDPEKPLCSDETVTLIATVFGGLALVVFLETLFAAPRPPEELHAVSASEFAFPSGHTMAATVFWGAVVHLRSHGQFRTRLLLAGTAVSLVALSRLALGVHYLVDVVAAVGFGVAYLAAMDRIPDRNPTYAFAIAAIIAILAVLITGANSRSLLAFAGTVGAAIGWRVVEFTPVKRTVVATVAKVR